MRWASPLLLVAAIAASCNWPAGSTSTGAGTDTGGDAGVACSATNPCSTCPSCALSSACAALWTTCQSNPACQSIDGCAVACTDSTCLQSCYAQNPDGANDYKAVHDCVHCQQCPCTGQCF
jgi:hypothetical protein